MRLLLLLTLLLANLPTLAGERLSPVERERQEYRDRQEPHPPAPLRAGDGGARLRASAGAHPARRAAVVANLGQRLVELLEAIAHRVRDGLHAGHCYED